MLYFEGKVLAFHQGLTTQSAGAHPWESKPWSWPMGLRPMLYYYAGDGVTGCGDVAVRQRRHAHRHARAVVARAARARRCRCGAWSPGPTGATARCSSATRAGHRAVVHGHRPPDVLLLHDAGRAVPRPRHRAGHGRDPRPGGRREGAAADRPARRRAVGGAGGGQLRLAVADPHRRADHARAMWDAQLWLPSWRA